MNAPKYRWLWLSVWAILALGGCEDCSGCGDEKIAELVAVKRSVERDYAKQQNAWKHAEVGTGFALNDGVRTSSHASAKISLLGHGGIELGPNTVIRFLEKAPGQGEHRLNVQAGEVTLSSKDQTIQFNTHMGVAYLRPNASVQITSNKDSMGLQVMIGHVTIEGTDTVELKQGEKLTLSIGGAILEGVGSAPKHAGPIEEINPAERSIVVSVEGKGSRFRSSPEARWEPLNPGQSTVVAGTEVELSRSASMDVSRGSESASVQGAAQVIIVPDDMHLLQVRRGKVQFESKQSDVQMLLPGGSIAGKGSVAPSILRVDVGKRLSTINTDSGHGDIVSKDAHASLSAGESAALYHTGVIEMINLIPKFADLTLPAGETATIHDASAPTAVRIRFGTQCPDEGAVEVSLSNSFAKLSMSSRGKGAAIISVIPGNNRYRVRCVKGGTASGNAVASGQLWVRKDTGAQQLPRRAPVNTVESDGRHYTVMFQNLLPELTFVWPGMDKGAGDYTLVLEPTRGGKAQRIATRGPRLTLESGQVTEGMYRWWFELGQPNKRSSVTTLQLLFDNAAQAAYVKEPEGAIAAGLSQVAVSGTAVDEATISVGGAALQTDAQYRFKGMVAVPKEDHALAIRIAQPQYGIHYYLRAITR